VIQYGPFLHGPAGIVIPIGFPVLLLLGLILVRAWEGEPAQGESTWKRPEGPSRQKLEILVIFLACFLLYNTVTFIRMSGDTTPAQVIPLSILQYGSLSLDQFRSYFATPDNLYAFVQVGGHYYSYFPIVTPVLLTPLYVVPYQLIMAFQPPLSNADIAPLARFAAAMVASAGVVLVYLSARALFSKTAALLSAITYAFGTATWAISSQAPWQHGMVELFLAAMIYVVLRREASGRGYHLVLLGILSGLLVMARPPDAILVLPMAWYVVRYSFRQAPLYFLPAFLSGLPFVLYNALVFGSFFGGYQRGIAEFMFDPGAVNRFAGLLFAPNVGLFIFSPVLILGILGYLYARDIPNERIRGLLLLYGPVFLLLVLLYSFYPGWGGVGYGPRFLTGILPAYILYVGLFLDRALRAPGGAARKAALSVFALLLLVSIGIQVIGAFYFPFLKDLSVTDRRMWDPGDLLILRSYRDGSGKIDAIQVNSMPPLPPLLTLDLRSPRTTPGPGEPSPGGNASIAGQNITPSQVIGVHALP
jgi:hypothetical protein